MTCFGTGENPVVRSAYARVDQKEMVETHMVLVVPARIRSNVTRTNPRRRLSCARYVGSGQGRPIW